VEDAVYALQGFLIFHIHTIICLVIVFQWPTANTAEENTVCESQCV